MATRAAVSAIQSDAPAGLILPPEVVQAFGQVLQNPQLDPAFIELVLTLPSETYLAEQLSVVDEQMIREQKQLWKTEKNKDIFKQ